MQIKSCLKTQGLLNVIHYTVYLFISNIGTGSPGGRQRQAERPKSRRVNYQQNELFHPQQPPPAPPRLSASWAPPPAARPQRPLALPAVPRSPGGSSGLALLFVFLSLFFDRSLCLSFCDLVFLSPSLCLSLSLLSLFGCLLLWGLGFFCSPGLFSSCKRVRDLESSRRLQDAVWMQWMASPGPGYPSCTHLLKEARPWNAWLGTQWPRSYCFSGNPDPGFQGLCENDLEMCI